MRLHTHLAETVEEEAFCRSTFGCAPAEYVEELGWLGEDVWFAHGVHLDEVAIKRLGETGTGVAHCPTSNGRLGAGLAPVRDLVDAGVPVGLGVDGSASNEESSLAAELHAALLVSRLRGPSHALAARDALALATLGGALVLGRSSDLGSLEVGKLADLALWRVDGLAHAGIADPVAALVLGSRPPLAMLMVDGEVVVEDDVLLTADERVAGGRRGACGRPADGAEGAMTDVSTVAGTRDGVGSSAVAAGRRAEGARRVRLLLRPLDGRHAVGRDPAQPARARADHPDRDRRRPGRPGGLRGADPRGRARASTPTGSSTATSRCSPPTGCATRARPSRSSPPTTPRPRGVRWTWSRSSTTPCRP